MATRRSLWRFAVAALPFACGSGSAGPGAPDALADGANKPDASVPDATVADEAARDGNGPDVSVKSPCEAAPCQPTVLASGTNPSTAGGLVVDSTNVYWLDSASGQVLACAKTGCGLAPTVLASGQGGPSGIAISGGTVYWTNMTAGSVASCAVGGCAKSPTQVASGLVSPGGIAVDASNVYWVETGKTGNVASCPLAGCTSPLVLASVPGLLLAVDDASVYFTDGAGVNVCPLAGCPAAPTVLFAAPGATGIALDSANVYVTTDLTGIDSASGAVLSCAKAGCAGKPVALATGQAAPLPVAVDSTSAYWGNTQGDADIWACATVGCKQAPQIITMAALPISLAVDDTRIYWSSLGSVLSIPK
jgi:hypothetical protein